MAAGIDALLKYFSSTLEIKFLQEFGAGVHEEYMNMESNEEHSTPLDGSS